jgi:hypothetical protein
MKQIVLSPSMGKRLIGKGMLAHPSIQRVLQHGRLVIVAGSTNGYVAEEVLRSINQVEGFSRTGFRRGITTSPITNPPRIDFPGDVVIGDGVWQKGLTVQEVAEDLVTGDVVLKGANALDRHGQAAVQIGHPKGGAILSVMPAIIGRRVELIVPVGLEKRVIDDINDLVLKVLAIDTEGPRLTPLPGKTFTEIDAIRLLTGAEATLIAAGGIYGAEGASWLGISGAMEQVDAAMELLQSISAEPQCEI